MEEVVGATTVLAQRHAPDGRSASTCPLTANTSDRLRGDQRIPPLAGFWSKDRSRPGFKRLPPALGVGLPHRGNDASLSMFRL